MLVVIFSALAVRGNVLIFEVFKRKNLSGMSDIMRMDKNNIYATD